MKYRQLGASGLRVSALSFGTNTFGGRGIFAALGTTDEPQARRLLALAIERGVNLFDTADEYSDGEAERILGDALKNRREQVLISTKVRTATGPGPNDAGSSRYHLIRAVDASLQRLHTDYVDLLSLHAWDGQTPLDETMSTLEALVRAGKVRYIGACNFSAWHLCTALGVARSRAYQPLVSHQMHYSLACRDAENELIPAAIHHGVGVLVWSPLAGGWLTAKYPRSGAIPGSGRHANGWNEPPIADHDRLHSLIEALVAIAQTHDITPACVALAWLLQRPGVTSVVLGARKESQLQANLDAVDVCLTHADISALDAITETPLPYPLWHQAKLSTDRLSLADSVALRHPLPERP